MLVSFPAMQGVIGQRTYYSCLLKLSAIPKMFTFRDWVEFTPEDREQRVLNRKRVPDIAKYILDNEDGYLFSSITASYKCSVIFKPVSNGSMLGTLEMDFEDANFVINDGQHRCAAIAAAIKENPALTEESISVLLFPYENRARVQQMFSDLNRFVVKTSKSLDILYDKRDPMSLVTLEVCEKVSVFQDQVDKDAVSLPVRSRMLFSLSSLYDGNCELLRGFVETASHHEMVAIAFDFWTAVSKVVPGWGKVKAREWNAMDLRQQSISSHSVVLRAIGGIGGDIMRDFPSDWRGKLLDLTTVNWYKSNHDWENICIVAGSVVSNRQARVATKAYLKKHMGLTLTDQERRCLPASGDDKGTSERDKRSDEVTPLDILDILDDPRVCMARNVTDKFLFILSWAYSRRTEQFAGVSSVKGNHRIYFSQSPEEIEDSGTNTNPKQIPGTPYWVMTNNSTDKKKEILMKVLCDVLDYDHEGARRALTCLDDQ